MLNKTSVQWPSLKPAHEYNAAIENQIDDFLARMSIEEKVGQIIQPEIRYVTAQDVKEFHLGSVLNGGGSLPNNNRYATVADWLAIADAYYAASMDESDGSTAIPIMWGTDAVHGVGNIVGATLFPHNIALGACHNPELIKRIGEITALEIAVIGLDWDFSPTVAVVRDDRWGRTYESYAENPDVVYEYAAKMVEGLQGTVGTQEFLSTHHVIATAKHFIGDGGTLNGIDRGNCILSEEELRDIHAAGYFSAIEAGVQTVMASFNSWHGDNMHGHQYLLTDVLKGKLGFDGLVVGDWNGHSFVSGCSMLSCPEVINAGLDMLMVADPAWKILWQNTLNQVREKIISPARIDDAVRRILRVKLRADLWRKGLPSTRSMAGNSHVLGSAAHRDVARQAVRESIVLLKNNNNLLPLSPSLKVLIAGDGADNISKQTGGWSVNWQGTGNSMEDFPQATTLWMGIEAAVSAGGGQASLSADGSYTDKPDVAIVIFGEDPYAEMQGDLQNLLLKSGDEKDLFLLKKLKAEGIPVVALFITGRPLWVNRELNACDAFAVIWQPGTEGAGVADIIFTDNQNNIQYDVTGRLTFSWPKHPEQPPQNIGAEHYDPLFPYGFGLSYCDSDTLEDNLLEDGLEFQKAEAKRPLFNRRAISPYHIVLQGCSNDHVAMNGNYASVSSVSVESVDRDVQEDARRVVWNGKGEGQVALAALSRQVLSDYLLTNSALIFDLKMNSYPQGEVFVRLGCGPSCYSDINITNQCIAIVDKGWKTICLDLNLFPAAASDFGLRRTTEELFSLVLEPFSLVANTSLDLVFSNVYIEKYRANNNGITKDQTKGGFEGENTILSASVFA